MNLASQRPIFVVGAPRSGTTLLRYMISSHPRIYIPPESNFIPRLFLGRAHELIDSRQAARLLKNVFSRRQFVKHWRAERPNAAALLNGNSFSTPAVFIDRLYSLYARQYGAERWGDKSPIYTGYMDLIAEIFPTAQFVHILRDGRDVALSTLDAYQAKRFYVDVFYAAWNWRRRIRKAFASASRLRPGKYYEVRYEKLTADPDSELRKICNFLGEEYVEAMTQPHLLGQEFARAKGLHAPVRKPPSTNSSGRWRRQMSLEDQRLFQAVAGDLLDELGYGTVELGIMSVKEKARYAALASKYFVLENGRRVLEFWGYVDPH